MTEYIPTTEEVRETYFITGYKTTPEQFDRWLAEHDREISIQAWKDGYTAGSKNPYRGEA